MSYSNRIFVYGPVGLLLLIALIYSLHWRTKANELAAALDRANHAEIIPGVAFAFAEKSVGGFPFRLDAVLSGVTFARHTPEGEFAWRTEKLAMHALSYRGDRFIFETDGVQSFASPGAPGQVPKIVLVTPAAARASAILQGGRLARFDVDVWEPQGKDATQGADPKRTFAAARAQLHFLSRGDNTIDVAMKIDNARIGEGYVPGAMSETDVRLVDMRGKLTESEALEPLKAGTADPANAAEDWRRRKGALAVSDLLVNWTSARADLKGNLALDGNYRPNGVLIGNGVESDGKTPAGYGLVFADGGMRMVIRSGLVLSVP